MTCKKCGNYFSSKCVIDGVHKSLSRRGFCLTCLPFNAKANKTAEWKSLVGKYSYVKKDSGARRCSDCGKPIQRKRVCNSCSVSRTREKKWSMIQKIIGNTCCACGYGGEGRQSILDLHHVEKRLFSVNSGSVNFGNERLLMEVRKCILVCCRCHREIHKELISPERVRQLFSEYWTDGRVAEFGLRLAVANRPWVTPPQVQILSLPPTVC